jgi:hypothetical protein
MKQILIVNVHSMIDVITNSSTELFVCDTDKSIETVKELLKELLEKYDELENVGCEDKSYRDFDSVFGRIEKVEDINQLYDFITGYDSSIPEFLMSKSYEESRKLEKKWFRNNKNKLEEKYLGKIIIEGASDNSIPYDLWDHINSLFNGYNKHLG